MIREIIKFTEDLIEDIPDIMQWNQTPSKGLHVFIDIDDNGNWTNRELVKGVDYDYYDGKNSDIKLWDDCVKYQSVTDYITMNKVQKFDSKQKIHSCSPYCIAYNFNFNDVDKKIYGIQTFKKGDKVSENERLTNQQLIREKRKQIIFSRLNDYKCNSIKMLYGDTKCNENIKIDNFFKNIKENFSTIEMIDEYSLLQEKDYLRIYLRSVSFEEQERAYSFYLKNEILNGEILPESDKGLLSFLTTFPDKKPFMKHRTSVLLKGISQRFSKEEALLLDNFGKLLKRKVLPNPLPIVIDKREINREYIKIFNKPGEPLSYRELLNKLFSEGNIKELSDYYLLNHSKTMSGLQINDIDFVPLFRYYMTPNVKVINNTLAGEFNKKEFIPIKDISLDTIFDFERIVVKEIFNNSLVKIKEEKYTVSYFGDIDPTYVSGGDIMYNNIMKYRKAFYDYIYKSRLNAINGLMFEDMMYQSILSNIHTDTIKGRFEWNNSIKKKINIWFSLYKLFNQNKNTDIMASKITDLMSKMNSVAKGESILETNEEFAFAAGQIVAYLIDKSVASDKNYSLLEPFLQKTKTGQLQDVIAQTFAIYKHAISTYKGKFQFLASNVLTYDTNVDFKPLLKYFLAGCFTPGEIYISEKKDNN